MAGVSLRVDDAPIPIHLAARRGPMNFGQNWRGVPVLERPYTLTLPRAMVLGAVDALLPDFRADAEAHPDPDDALEQAWRRLAWAPARRALADPTFLRHVVDFLAIDLLDQALPATAGIVWMLNTVDDARLQGAQVVLCGRAGRLQTDRGPSPLVP